MPTAKTTTHTLEYPEYLGSDEQLVDMICNPSVRHNNAHQLGNVPVLTKVGLPFPADSSEFLDGEEQGEDNKDNLHGQLEESKPSVVVEESEGVDVVVRDHPPSWKELGEDCDSTEEVDLECYN